MEYIIKDATDRELAAMKRYTSDYMDWSNVKKEEDRIKLMQGKCSEGGEHLWERKMINQNKMIRYCLKNCGIVKVKYFTNDDLGYINKHLDEFAQPGSKLWHKIYGNRTQEEVAKMKHI